MRILTHLTLICVLVFGLTTISGAQSFENTTSVIIHGGVAVPTGDIADSQNAGPTGQLTFRFPMTSSHHAGLNIGFVDLKQDGNGNELLLFPAHLSVYFPFAPETAGSPYATVGFGATYNREKYTDTLGVDQTDNSVYSGALLGIGYTLRPEAMPNTYFDILLTYNQQFILDNPDYRAINFLIGIGFAL